MVTRKPVRASAQDADPLFVIQGSQSSYSGLPPTPDAGNGHRGGEPEACRLVLVNLSAYQDNELDPDQADLITQHLDNCADCGALLDSMQMADEEIVREWREGTPLPSSLQFKQSIDSIMDALPPAPATVETFAPKRVHARTRWIRFATGLSGLIAAVGLLWSSYELGYVHGRNNSRRGWNGSSQSGARTAANSDLSYLSIASLSSSAPPGSTSLTYSASRNDRR